MVNPDLVLDKELRKDVTLREFFLLVKERNLAFEFIDILDNGKTHVRFTARNYDSMKEFKQLINNH
tara:strand:- start:1691 stop:1888 length:198 start_codon:yes stop_codon:yes gene_type:complete